MTVARPTADTLALNPMAALVNDYNAVTEAMDLASVQKFADKATAVKRVVAITDKALAAGFEITWLVNGAIDSIVAGTPATQAGTTDQFTQASTTDQSNTDQPNAEPASTTPADQTESPAEPPVQSSPKASAKKAKSSGERAVRVSPMLAKTITLQTPENPKRRGSRTEVRYSLYRTGMTGAEFMAECLAGNLGTNREILSDLAYDSKMGFIALS